MKRPKATSRRNTTLEEDRHTMAARQINFIWELTQSSIAIMIVGANIASTFVLVVQNSILSNSLFLIIGFYFGRTNHARPGGLPDIRLGRARNKEEHSSL